jgi:putative transposase
MIIQRFGKLLSDKLAKAQRAKKKKLTRSLHAKIKNQRKDYLHKVTTALTRDHTLIFVGDVSSVKLKRTKMAASVTDASWYNFKTMLAYKAIRLGVVYKEINEKFSTVTCSSCLQRTGPSGLSALGVREWTCTCGAHHDRDVNAAKNILRFGHESRINGAAKAEVPKKITYDSKSKQ